MAISEVCKFEVKDEIDRYVKTEGISRNEASKKLAAWFTDILGKEIKPETIRQKDLRARQELATNVATDEWPKCKNGTKGKCGIWGGDLPVATMNGKPASHGLCLHCRREELREQRLNKLRQELEVATKEFEATSVDAKSDKFWNELSNQMLKIFKTINDIPCEKVSEEVFRKIKGWSGNLNYCLTLVSTRSANPEMPST